MFAYLKGIITYKDVSSAIVECNGVGYSVKIALSTYNLLILDQETLIYTFYQVREDAHVLYGFIDEKEKKMFEMLLNVNGVGGNTALAILSALSVGEIQDAISSGKVEIIKKVRGIGQKTAERIVLELKDKIETTSRMINDSSDTISSTSVRSEAVSALTSLGFQRIVIEKRVDEILKQNPTIGLEELIKLGLK